MTEPTLSSPPPRKRGWLRWITWIAGLLILLIVAVYFAATSSAFLKRVILPRVSQSLGADITVSDASIRPFKEIILRDLKIQARGQEPVLLAPEVRVRYSLLDIIGGTLHVDDVTLESPGVLLVENPDGTSNLDALLKARPATTQPAPSSHPAKPPRIDLGKFTLHNAGLRKIKNYGPNHRDVLALTNLNLTLAGVKNGQAGSLRLDAALRMESNPPSGTNGFVEATLTSRLDFSLSSNLKPGPVQGDTRLVIARAGGAFADVASFQAVLGCDITPTECKQIALRFQKGDLPLGQVVVRGPFDAEKLEGRLVVELDGIDQRLLNLLGAPGGLDFGTTTIVATNQIQFADSGSAFSIAGGFAVRNLQLTRAGQTTPRLDLRSDYVVKVNRAENRARLDLLSLTASRNGQLLLRGELTSPMPLAWGQTAAAPGDSSLNLTVTNLNLADWKPFLGEAAPPGDLALKLKLKSRQGGNQLAFDLDSQLGILPVQTGDQPAFSVSGSGTYDRVANAAEIEVALTSLLPKLCPALKRPDLVASSGTLELKGRLTQKQNAQTFTGQVRLADFTGQFGENAFRAFGCQMNLDIDRTPEQIQIRKIVGNLSQSGNDGGGFELSGSYHPANQSAQFAARFSDFNQNGLRPFLQPLLKDQKLVSVALNGNAAVQYDPAGNSTLKADVQVTNLVVRHPTQALAGLPLDTGLHLDAALRNQTAEVRRFQISLTPTARAQNQVQLQGRVDFSQTDALQGNLKLTTDSLDVTRYYELLAGKATTGTKPNPSAAPETAPPAAPRSDQEPPPIKLPFHNFTIEIGAGRLYLHQIEITNLQATVNLDGGHVLLKPLELTLNGAPVSATADLDLGMTGYKYDATFSAQRIPLTPVVNSLEPDRAGQIGGTTTIDVQVSGAGITDASLQKNLNGRFNVLATNLNFSIANVRSKVVNAVINVLVGIPDLIHNPTSLVGNLLGQPGGTSKGAKAGWADELTAAPLDVIAARVSAGKGVVSLQDAVVRSAAFQAEAKGVIALASVLTNSTLQIPVKISLSRSLADRAGLLPAGTPTNTAYASLPDFLKLQGTLGNPKTDVNKLVLVELAARTGVGVASQIGNGTGGQAGKVLGTVGALLNGTPPAPTTNSSAVPPPKPPPARQSPANNLLNQLLKPK
jgi:hypothetical protein